ncbi:hypothetical protein DL771_009447 [Monosporascus sp. 5C6A]|nr:hypothetical protein DL771_009447 [Monosporascus sp. 5C6A]
MALLMPPPDRNYPSFEALFRDVQAHAKTQGYCLNPQAKHKNIRYEVKCDKAGKYVSKATPGPNTKQKTSKKTNCPMRASAVYDPHEACWKFRVIDPRHNHLPSESPAEHARHRQDERDQQRGIIEEGLQRGDSGPVIYQAILDQFPDTITSLRDIDNVIQAIKKARREDPESLGPRRKKLIGPVIPDLGKKVPKKPWLPELRRLKDTIRERDKRLEALEREREEFQLRITRLEQVLYRQHPPPPPPPPAPVNHMPQPTVQVLPQTPAVLPSIPPGPQMNFKVITPTTWKA